MQRINTQISFSKEILKGKVEVKRKRGRPRKIRLGNIEELIIAVR